MGALLQNLELESYKQDFALCSEDTKNRGNYTIQC